MSEWLELLVCVCVFLSLLVSACMCLHLCVCLYVPSLVCLQWHVCLYVWMWEFVSESASWSLCMCLFGAFHVLYDFPKKQHYQYAFWISINCYDNTNFKFILYLHVLLTVDKKKKKKNEILIFTVKSILSITRLTK